MARKTKAQREAEAQALRDQQEEAAREAYPDLLMDVLERATILHFKITVVNQKFYVKAGASDYAPSWDLTYNYTPQADSDLDMLRWEIETQERAEAEANRKYLAKQSALAKLSQEERELLGL